MVGQLSLTKPFTYFLYFRSQNLLYFGRAASSARYRGFIPGSLFTGPHHNPDVNNVLEVEPALWIVHREFDSIEQCQRYEEQYLNLYWSDGEWSSRPKWLLNRSNKSGGGSFPPDPERKGPAKMVSSKVDAIEPMEVEGRILGGIDEAAFISEADIEKALEEWKDEAPARFKELLEADNAE